MLINNLIDKTLPLLVCLDYTCILFLLGLSGLIINKRNILLMLLSLELTFLASALNFIFAGYFLNIFLGAIYGILVILVVVADTGIGLSLIVLIYRGSKTASVNSLVTLRG
jgi:NADH-quinone oxidoreductase subunit K